MRVAKTQNSKLKTQNYNAKVKDSLIVSDEKKTVWKNIFGVFSQFVAIGGDFV